jgi:hypothetical protein
MGGGRLHAFPLSLYLPSQAKLWCTLQRRGQIHSSYFCSTLICTLWVSSRWRHLINPSFHFTFLLVNIFLSKHFFLSEFELNYLRKSEDKCCMYQELWRNISFTHNDENFLKMLQCEEKGIIEEILFHNCTALKNRFSYYGKA